MGRMSRWLCLLVLLPGCSMPQDVSESLAALYDRYLAERAALDPDWATGVGLHDHDGRLTRYDDASWRARIDFVDRWLALVPGDSLDARLWRSDLLSQQHDYRRRDARTVTPANRTRTMNTMRVFCAYIVTGPQASTMARNRSKSRRSSGGRPRKWSSSE